MQALQRSARREQMMIQALKKRTKLQREGELLGAIALGHQQKIQRLQRRRQEAARELMNPEIQWTSPEIRRPPSELGTDQLEVPLGTRSTLHNSDIKKVIATTAPPHIISPVPPPPKDRPRDIPTKLPLQSDKPEGDVTYQPNTDNQRIVVSAEDDGPHPDPLVWFDPSDAKWRWALKDTPYWKDQTGPNPFKWYVPIPQWMRQSDIDRIVYHKGTVDPRIEWTERFDAFGSFMPLAGRPGIRGPMYGPKLKIE